MGRTIVPPRQLLEQKEAEWDTFMRALRKEDQDALKELWAMAHHQSAPMANAAAPDPFEAILLSMLIGLMRRVRHLENAQSVREAIVNAAEWEKICDT
jgi:hypothetical protein